MSIFIDKECTSDGPSSLAQAGPPPAHPF